MLRDGSAGLAATGGLSRDFSEPFREGTDVGDSERLLSFVPVRWEAWTLSDLADFPLALVERCGVEVDVDGVGIDLGTRISELV